MPRQGDLTTLRIVRELENELSFSEEEHAVLQFEQEGASVKWQTSGAVDKPFEFGPKATDIVLKAIADLDEKKALTMDWLTLCDKLGYEGSQDADEQ